MQDSPPKAVQPPPFVRKLEPIDYAAYAAMGIALLAGVGVLLCLVTGNAFTATILAFLILAIGMLPAIAFATSRSDQLRCRAEANEASMQITEATKLNEDAVRKWRVFEAEFDRLVAEERAAIYREIEGRERRAEESLAFASNREKTVDGLGKRFLNDTVKWVSSKLTGQNFTTQKTQLLRAIEFCRKHEYEVAAEMEARLLDELRQEYEAVLRREHERAEQARIKARIREEQRAEQEIEREMRRIEAEKRAIEKALADALARAAGVHSAEVELLQQKLAEAEAKGERAMSMAQQTRAGNIYVISNIGSFGECVFKVGMTRRLEPLDRVRELGDASVPFPFDVHMMISCDDAPKLENVLHKALHHCRVNKVNLRKEYFRTDIETIRKLVIDNHGEVSYVVDPEALQYRESMTMSDADFELISQVQQELGIDGDDEE